MAPIYYRGADAAILVFDHRDPQSLTAVKSWIQELRSAPGVPSNIALVIAANKVDEEEEIDPRTCEIKLIKDAVTLALSQEADLFCTSAKTKIGLEPLFLKIAQSLIENYKENNLHADPNSVRLPNQKHKKESNEGGCC